MGGALRFAQGDRQSLQIRVGAEHTVGQFLVFFAFQTAGFDIDVDMNIDRLLAVLLVSDADVRQLDQAPA